MGATGVEAMGAVASAAVEMVAQGWESEALGAGSEVAEEEQAPQQALTVVHLELDVVD